MPNVATHINTLIIFAFVYTHVVVYMYVHMSHLVLYIYECQLIFGDKAKNARYVTEYVCFAQINSIYVVIHMCA